MEQKEIFELISRFENSSLNILEIEQDSFKVHLEKGITAPAAPAVMQVPVQALATAAAACAPSASAPQTAQAQAPGINPEPAAAASPYETIKSPIVGVYYASPSPDAEPYVRPGDKVTKGQVLCLVEAMKMMNELKAPRDGIIRKIHGVNGELVEFDQILFEVEPC